MMLNRTDYECFRYIVQQQIEDLMLRNNGKNTMIESLKNYTINLYGHILSLFKNLQDLSIIETFDVFYPS
jgi:hypothetical protein